MPWGWRLWKFKNINFISKFKRNFICLINNKLSLIRFEFLFKYFKILNVILVIFIKSFDLKNNNYKNNLILLKLIKIIL
jgi:hypothetical protein